MDSPEIWVFREVAELFLCFRRNYQVSASATCLRCQSAVLVRSLVVSSPDLRMVTGLWWDVWREESLVFSVF